MSSKFSNDRKESVILFNDLFYSHQPKIATFSPFSARRIVLLKRDKSMHTPHPLCMEVTQEEYSTKTTDRRLRAQGCLLGQLSGDALGSLVEFQSPEEIRAGYPGGVRKMEDGGTWDTLAGQPTDDSEMALLLARLLVKRGAYNHKAARKEYERWLNTKPFDCGMTTRLGLTGSPDTKSQANGALMRISPLGIFGSHIRVNQVAEWAMQDAALTHPHPICQQANALFAMGIAYAVASGCGPEELYGHMKAGAIDRAIDVKLSDAIDRAETEPPKDYLSQQGWVLIAFQNALYQLLHVRDLEEGVVNTIMQGGDTDTNAAIAGALLGAVYGKEGIPKQWIGTLQGCRPARGTPRVKHPRPRCFWPTDALDLAERLEGAYSEDITDKGQRGDER